MGQLTFRMKRHDRSPPLEYIQIEDDGRPADLSVYTSAKFFMKKRRAEVLKVDGAVAQIVAGEDGMVRYAWAPTDTDDSGVFFGEFELIDAEGRKRTLPADSQIRIEIAGDLDDA